MVGWDRKASLLRVLAQHWSIATAICRSAIWFLTFNWQLIVFSDESRNKLHFKDWYMWVSQTIQKCVPSLEELYRYSHRTNTWHAIVWSAIVYRLLQIEGILNSKRYIKEVVESEVFNACILFFNAHQVFRKSCSVFSSASLFTGGFRCFHMAC